MKKILGLITLAFAAAACSAEATKAAPAKPPVAQSATAEKSAPEQKKVCIKVWDAKLNKEVEKCRTLKIHEKHEGNKVPTK
jgi:hypothetical protein